MVGGSFLLMWGLSCTKGSGESVLSVCRYVSATDAWIGRELSSPINHARRTGRFEK